jgi:uncharacterized protein (DUF488 family)
MDRATNFFTIGHSTRTIDEFVHLLKIADIRLVVDVRTIPRSRTNPQYNKDTLPSTLAEFQLRYEHFPALGGRRGRSYDIAPEVNGFWINQSFHNYADYAISDDFNRGFERLRKLGHECRCVIMCSEAVWWRCHRRIITDYLLSAGEDVFHILSEDHIDLAMLTPTVVSHADGTLTYPHVPASTGG